MGFNPAISSSLSLAHYLFTLTNSAVAAIERPIGITSHCQRFYIHDVDQLHFINNVKYVYNKGDLKK